MTKRTTTAREARNLTHLIVGLMPVNRTACGRKGASYGGVGVDYLGRVTCPDCQRVAG